MYPGVWRHGDWIEITSRGTAIISGRSDSTINRGGVRIGTSEIYRAVALSPKCVDALVVDLPWPGTAGWIVLFVVLADGARLDDELTSRIAARLREDCSPRHTPDEVRQVDAVPADDLRQARRGPGQAHPDGRRSGDRREPRVARRSRRARPLRRARTERRAARPASVESARGHDLLRRRGPPPRAAAALRGARRLRLHGARGNPERAGDHEPLDLVGSLADREDLRVPVEPADRVLLDVAVAAVDLHRLVGGPQRDETRLELRLGRREGERTARVLQPRGLVGEEAGRLDLGRHVGELRRRSPGSGRSAARTRGAPSRRRGPRRTRPARARPPSRRRRSGRCPAPRRTASGRCRARRAGSPRERGSR